MYLTSDYFFQHFIKYVGEYNDLFTNRSAGQKWLNAIRVMLYCILPFPDWSRQIVTVLGIRHRHTKHPFASPYDTAGRPLTPMWSPSRRVWDVHATLRVEHAHPSQKGVFQTQPSAVFNCTNLFFAPKPDQASTISRLLPCGLYLTGRDEKALAVYFCSKSTGAAEPVDF